MQAQVEKKEITLAELLNIAGPGQLVTITDEKSIIEEKPYIYKGNKAKLKRDGIYRELSKRERRHISTVHDAMIGRSERGSEIVLRG